MQKFRKQITRIEKVVKTEQYYFLSDWFSPFRSRESDNMLNQFLVSFFVYHVRQQHLMSKKRYFGCLSSNKFAWNTKLNFLFQIFLIPEKVVGSLLWRFVEREIFVRRLRHERRSKRSKTQTIFFLFWVFFV
jgi:hypothetical protein